MVYIVILVCDSKLLLNDLSYRNERWSEYFRGRCIGF